MAPIDPTPFNPAAWGIFGILAFVITCLIGIIWRLFSKMTTDQTKRDEVLMGFVNTHRTETTTALKDLGEKISSSYNDLKQVFSEQMAILKMQGVTLNEVHAAQRIVTELGRLRDAGRPTEHADIEQVVRGVLGELKMRRSSSEP